MKHIRSTFVAAAVLAIGAVTIGLACQDPGKKGPSPQAQDREGRPAGQAETSYLPVAGTEKLANVVARMKEAKPEVLRRQLALLEERYDLSDRPAKGILMCRGKAIQEGVRVRLPRDVTWASLSKLTAEEVREKDLFPKGFLPLPHPHQAEGGMLFPKFHIEEIQRQEQRDLTRFDLDFDLPDHFLPEFPPPIFLTTV